LGAVEPVLHRRQGRLAAASPQAARRQLQHRQVDARRHRQRLGITPGPAHGQGVAKLGGGERSPPQHVARRRDDLGLVQPGQGATVDAAVGQEPVQTRLDQRPDRREVRRGRHVQGPAHQRAARQAEILQPVGQVTRREGLQPGPEREVRRLGRLGLQGDQAIQRLGNVQFGAPQQMLSRQQRPVQRPAIQGLFGGIPARHAGRPVYAIVL
jgi:hypothetical protein